MNGNMFAHPIMIVKVEFLADLISIKMTQPQHHGAKVECVLPTGTIGIAVGLETLT